MPSPVIAFGWTSLPMLGWLAAAAMPLLIHLWSRRRYRETAWAAAAFLLAAMRRERRRMFIEQWLLLAVRTSLIALVVLAAAEPYFQRPLAAVSPGGRAHRVLVFDGSYSMAYRPADKTRFDRAKELARRLVADSPQGNVFTLVVMSASPRVVVGTAALDSGAILEEIDALELPHAGADLTRAMPAIRSLIESVAAENRRIDRHEVFFLTDMHRRTWAPEMSDAARAEFLRQTGELAQAADLFVLDLGQPSVENLAIVDLRAAEAVIAAGRESAFEVRLRAFGRRARDRQRIEWFIDGRRVGESEAAFMPDGTASTVFSYRFDAPGDHAVEARASGDALDIDNHRYLAAKVRASIRALCVEGRPSGGAFRGAADYLAVALNPRGAADGGALIQAETAPESAILERGLAAFDCVFLCNVAQFTAGEARALDAYLQSGGSLVFFLGDQVMAERYNRELGVADRFAPSGGTAAEVPPVKQDLPKRELPALLPARIGSLVDRPQFRLDPLGWEHPILEVFRGRGQAGLLTTPIFKHFQFELPKDGFTRTVLKLGGGDPLMVERRVHRGRVVLVATSPEPAWTALPLWPSFVPLVQELTVWLAAGQAACDNIAVGESWHGFLASSASADLPKVRMPDGRRRTVQTQSVADGRELAFSDTWQSGFYAVSQGRTAERESLFAVNVDTAESDLAVVGVEELREDLWPGIPFLYQTTWHDFDTAEAAAGAARGRSRLHVLLLYAAMALAFADTFLAWKIGGGKSILAKDEG